MAELSCAITQEVMRDPVIAQGQRTMLLVVIAQGQRTTLVYVTRHTVYEQTVSNFPNPRVSPYSLLWYLRNALISVWGGGSC